MTINLIELINLLIVFCLFVFIFRTRTNGWLIACFVYGSLYFTYSAIPLLVGSTFEDINAVHMKGSGLVVKATTILFLICFFISMIKRYGLVTINNRLAIFISSLMITIFLGYLHNYRVNDTLQFQNIAAIEILLGISLFGFMEARYKGSKLVLNQSHYVMINLLLIVSAIIGFYEVFSHKSWAYTVESSGDYIYRASSIFFNPNLYGFWTGLIYLGFSYYLKFTQRAVDFKNIISGMILASIGMYLSGSRSFMLILIGLLFLSALLSTNKNKSYRWTPLLVILFTFLTVYLFAKINILYGATSWKSLALLGERLFNTPFNLANYLVSKFVHIDMFTPVSSQVELSIQGRLLGAMSDSGFITLTYDAGLLGLIAMLSLYVILLLDGVHRYVYHPGELNIYLIAILLFIIFSGMVMRFQIFPVCILDGVVLAVYMSNFRNKANLFRG